MPPKVNRIGLRFGRLLVIDQAESLKSGVIRWLCRCDCGVEKIVSSSTLVTGNTKSCGCFARDCVRGYVTTHGDVDSKEYFAWRGMRRRCDYKSGKQYHNYGGRGITVCDRWNTYQNFLDDMGRAPSKRHSLDRIDVNGNYEPENCKWATIEEQANNTRRTVKHEYLGYIKSITQWAQALGVKYSFMYRQLRIHGNSVEDVILKINYNSSLIHVQNSST